MTFKCNIKFRKKQVLQVSIFLSGVGILTWQIWKTFEAFIEENTTFTVSKNTIPQMGLPTILLCPINALSGFDHDFGNKTQFFKQFSWLNDGFKLTHYRYVFNSNGSISIYRFFC